MFTLTHLQLAIDVLMNVNMDLRRDDKKRTS